MTFGVDHIKYLEYGGFHIFGMSKRCGLTINDLFLELSIIMLDSCLVSVCYWFPSDLANQIRVYLRILWTCLL